MTDTNLLFTIITPSFNAGAAIKDVVESVLEQQFSDYEHLVVDGSSSDDTLSILEAYPSVRLVSEPDKGIYDAMNKGIRLARGKWLHFLGADDIYIDSRVLADVAAQLDDHLDVVYGDVESDRFPDRYAGPFDELKIYYQNVCHQSIFFRKSVFDKTGMFNTRYKVHADWDHNLKWLIDPQIQSRYMDRVIANYADGGFSSRTPDAVFESDFTFNYINYGRDVLPFGVCIRKLISEGARSVMRRDIKRAAICLGKCIQLGSLRIFKPQG
ncbi:glycosyltransferase family 2 protein [Pseudomonadota bacterium]